MFDKILIANRGAEQRSLALRTEYCRRAQRAAIEPRSDHV
jgi:hypothetical protein